MNLPLTMKAMVFEAQGQPLEYQVVPVPTPLAHQVLIKLIACGVCRTDVHIVDGDLQHPIVPLIPGHEIVGIVVELGPGVTGLAVGKLVGVHWLGYTCGHCKYCLRGQENLCEHALFTGYTLNGGFAEYTVAFTHYCFPLPAMYGNAAGAPLLCAGLIGYRSYGKIHPSAKNIGIYGFGAAAHILTQVALHDGKKIFAFTSVGDLKAQAFALEMGATWAGDSTHTPPEVLDAAIIFASVGSLIPKALQDIDKGGIVVCGGIHMSDIPSFNYDILWGERTICSVANLTRNDGEKFLALAPKLPVKTQTTLFKLYQANEAISSIRDGSIQGAAVLVM